MHKFKEPLKDSEKQLLVNFSHKDFSNYSEADIREEVITPLITMLGYEKNSDYEVERESSFKTKEMFLNIGRKRIDLDYLCNIRKNNFWLIEAKNGKKKLITEQDIQQAYLYSLHPKINCRYFAVTNGWLFNLYDRNKFLKDDNADIFEPILSISHNEYQDKFEQLYHYLGSSNVLFNIKEDVLLKEIEKTMSSEVYLNRLSYFKIKVSNIIKKAECKVYKNISKLGEDKDNYKKYLESVDLCELPNIVFARRNTAENVNIGCSIIKKKLLSLGEPYKNGHLPVDSFMRNLLPYSKIYSINTYEPAYYYQITKLLLEFYKDKDFHKMLCNYNGKKIYLNDLLEEYLYELFSLFPNKPYVRLMVYLYVLAYRYAKILVYGFKPVNIIAELSLKYKEYILSEEELGKVFYSKGCEIINIAEIITQYVIKCIVNNIIDKEYHIKQNEAKSYIINLEKDIEMLSKKVDYDKILSTLPREEKDGMMAADSDMENPWRLILFAIFVEIPKYYNFSERCQKQLDILTQIGFIYNNTLDAENELKQKKVIEFLKYDFSIKETIL